MRLEVNDIIGGKRAHGCAQPPPGITLGRVFDQDAGLRELAKAVLQVSVNGTRVDDWRAAAPGINDDVKITIAPGEFLTAALFTIPSLFGVTSPIAVSLSMIFGVISVASFFVDLFNRPKSPKLSTGPRESPTYGIEGLQDTFAPGSPVPVTYGTHRQGGQVLMFYLDVASNSGGRGLVMSEQLGLCHGPVSSITAVEINRIPAEDVSSVSGQTRTGTASQSVMDGFDRIRNSFADGREVGSESIIYRSVSNAMESFDLILSAPALTAPNKKGNIRTQRVGYSVERRASGETAWTVVASPREVVGGSLQQLFFQHSFPLPSRGAYDVRVRKLSHLATNPEGAHRVFLHAVTEYQDVTGAYSGIAQIGVRAAATAQLQGGRPGTTALVHGKLVRVYSTTAVQTTTWTANPAWCVFDYMTSSVYGMKIPLADMDVQSFIDLATLASSQCNDCDLSLLTNGSSRTTTTITESTPVVVAAGGGSPDFSWSTTVGCLAVARGPSGYAQSATLSCPPNTRTVAGVAYGQRAHNMGCSACGDTGQAQCGNTANCVQPNACCVVWGGANRAQDRNCDGSANGGCTGNLGCAAPCCNTTCTATVGGPVVQDTGGADNGCGTFATASSSGGACGLITSSLTAGCVLDLRTAGMINSGCAPCVLTMSGGAVVTVTDRLGRSVSVTVDI